MSLGTTTTSMASVSYDARGLAGVSFWLGAGVPVGATTTSKVVSCDRRGLPESLLSLDNEGKLSWLGERCSPVLALNALFHRVKKASLLFCGLLLLGL